MTNPDYVLSVNDVYNAMAEGMAALDMLWPEDEPQLTRRDLLVELIDGIKLRLTQTAQKNADRYESPFESAARRVTGVKKPTHESPPPDPSGKSAMQLAHEAAQARMRSRPS